MGAPAEPEHADLRGEVVVVTGALGGIGSAIAVAFARRRATVVVHHLGQSDEASAMAAQLGCGAIAVEADVRRWDDVSAMMEQINSRLGRLDVLVNNAGIMDETPFLETTLENWQSTIDVDLTGVFVCSRLAAPRMATRGGGVIINMASQLAFKGAAGYAAYCAAKGGVVGLTRAMARELGPAIRVNAIAPGPVETDLIGPWATDEWRAERTGGLVIRRLAQPEEIAGAVVFLASPEADLMHGQTLHLNGGGVMA